MNIHECLQWCMDHNASVVFLKEDKSWHERKGIDVTVKTSIGLEIGSCGQVFVEVVNDLKEKWDSFVSEFPKERK